ncbi:unnamed protein product [Meganyctiphanes norvegica]|uniref:Glycerophosphocholine phosphodiesterase GPCPD1 n=1 Tax=Meganyctiphanes norvegica TaxID=48144 RepID=A0AAV2QHN8_MEGNR
MIEDRNWLFRVSCHTEPGEQLCVVGGSESLGSWDPEKMVLLQPLGRPTNEEDTVWERNVLVPTSEIQYRYCVCVILEPSITRPTRVLAIKRWETNLAPRKLPKDVSNESDPTTEIFGIYGGGIRVDQGWLVKDSVVQFKLCSSNIYSDPIVIWKKKYAERKVYCKITPVDITNSSSSSSESLKGGFMHDGTDTTEHEIGDLRENGKAFWPIMEVAAMKEGHCKFTKQGQFGVVANKGDFLVFQCRMLHPDVTAFLCDFYVEQPGEDIPRYLGFTFVLPSNLKENFGVATLPITSQKHLPIGQLTVHYMVINPMTNTQCDMKVSYARHWKDTWTGLEVGHRGAGNSYHAQPKSCANIRENTLASLKYAADSGADMVEFDVQLSKDLIPVIYHDFHACIALKRKKEQTHDDLLEIPIKDLTLSQLQALKDMSHLTEGIPCDILSYCEHDDMLYHIKENGMNKFLDEDLEDHQPFPTLQKALETVPQCCGFNIEVKWTMLLKDGSYELLHPLELNHFMDLILKVVLDYADHRKIVFSCFHPDICTMLRLKQNRYPVMFLTQGISDQWPPYEDQRTSTIDQAIFYSTNADILGINVHTEDLIRDNTQMQRALDHKLIVFCWGDDNNNQDTIKYLKSIGMHGIIYDKIDEYNTKDKKESIFLCETREASKLILKAAQQEPDSGSDSDGCPEAQKQHNGNSTNTEKLENSTNTEKHSCGTEKNTTFSGIMQKIQPV